MTGRGREEEGQKIFGVFDDWAEVSLMVSAWVAAILFPVLVLVLSLEC